jgi:hypothetical protein
MHFQHPALYLGTSPINDRGLFSTVRICAGEIIAVWDGFIATAAAVDLNFSAVTVIARRSARTSSSSYAACADHVNHSCHPNCGIVAATLVACATSAPGTHL